tara:strand:- start:341 stop:760 length:420 start_codon:yes stop_codon:yes gene_type:complete
MNDMPEDIIYYLNKYIHNYQDLLNFKFACKSFHNSITSFSLAKLMLYEKFLNYKSVDMCVNIDCYDDTIDIYEEVYHYGYRRYIHCHQEAINKKTITINKKKFNICSPYCSECFTNNVLIGDKKNVTHNFDMDEVNIDY